MMTGCRTRFAGSMLMLMTCAVVSEYGLPFCLSLHAAMKDSVMDFLV